MNEPDYEPDYIFAYQIESERLATWKRSAEWYVPPKSKMLTATRYMSKGYGLLASLGLGERRHDV